MRDKSCLRNKNPEKITGEICPKIRFFEFQQKDLTIKILFGPVCRVSTKPNHQAASFSFKNRFSEWSGIERAKNELRAELGEKIENSEKRLSHKIDEIGERVLHHEEEIAHLKESYL